MPKNKISEFSSTPANNTDIGGIDIAEGCAPSGINNAIRELMTQLKDMITGVDGDSQVVGGNLSVTGTSTLTGTVTAPAGVTANVTGNVTGNTSGTSANVTGTVLVANGGTGLTTLTANNVILGNGASTPSFVAPGASGNVLTSNGTTWQSTASNGLRAGTAQTMTVAGLPSASPAGAYADFTGIPSWVKRITVMFSGVSTNGTSVPLVQLGSGSVSTSGYDAVGTGYSTTIGTTNYTTGFGICDSSLTEAAFNGMLILTNVSGNIWAASGLFKRITGVGCNAAGAHALSGVLDRVRITTVNGTDLFDAGLVNIMYEG